MKLVVIGCLCAGTLAGAGCADGRGVPTGPGPIAGVSGLAATVPGVERTVQQAVAPSLSASPRSGDLSVTKECSGISDPSSPHCTIQSSNVKAIEGGSKIFYLQLDQLRTPAGSDVVLDVPGPGNNKAF